MNASPAPWSSPQSLTALLLSAWQHRRTCGLLSFGYIPFRAPWTIFHRICAPFVSHTLSPNLATLILSLNPFIAPTPLSRSRAQSRTPLSNVPQPAPRLPPLAARAGLHRVPRGAAAAATVAVPPAAQRRRHLRSTGRRRRAAAAPLARRRRSKGAQKGGRRRRARRGPRALQTVRTARRAAARPAARA